MRRVVDRIKACFIYPTDIPSGVPVIDDIVGAFTPHSITVVHGDVVHDKTDALLQVMSQVLLTQTSFVRKWTTALFKKDPPIILFLSYRDNPDILRKRLAMLLGIDALSQSPATETPYQTLHRFEQLGIKIRIDQARAYNSYYLPRQLLDEVVSVGRKPMAIFIDGLEIHDSTVDDVLNEFGQLSVPIVLTYASDPQSQVKAVLLENADHNFSLVSDADTAFNTSKLHYDRDGHSYFLTDLTTRT